MSESNLLYVIVDILQNSDTPQYIKNSLLKITALHNNKVWNRLYVNVVFLHMENYLH